MHNGRSVHVNFLDDLLVMRKKPLILRHLATVIQEVQEVVAATKTTAVTKTKEDTIIPEAIRADAEVAGIDKVDNIMATEAATLVGDTDHPR